VKKIILSFLFFALTVFFLQNKSYGNKFSSYKESYQLKDTALTRFYFNQLFDSSLSDNLFDQTLQLFYNSFPYQPADYDSMVNWHYAQTDVADIYFPGGYVNRSLITYYNSLQPTNYENQLAYNGKVIVTDNGIKNISLPDSIRNGPYEINTKWFYNYDLKIILELSTVCKYGDKIREPGSLYISGDCLPGTKRLFRHFMKFENNGQTRIPEFRRRGN
jgi:hypothetical protein